MLKAMLFQLCTIIIIFARSCIDCVARLPNKYWTLCAGDCCIKFSIIVMTSLKELLFCDKSYQLYYYTRHSQQRCMFTFMLENELVNELINIFHPTDYCYVLCLCMHFLQGRWAKIVHSILKNDISLQTDSPKSL